MALRPGWQNPLKSCTKIKLAFDKLGFFFFLQEVTRGSFSEVGGDEDWTTCLDVAAGDGVEDGVVVGVGTTVVGAVGPWTTMGGGSQLRRSASDPSSILAGVAADWIVVASLWSLHLFSIFKISGKLHHITLFTICYVTNSKGRRGENCPNRGRSCSNRGTSCPRRRDNCNCRGKLLEQKRWGQKLTFVTTCHEFRRSSRSYLLRTTIRRLGTTD